LDAGDAVVYLSAATDAHPSESQFERALVIVRLFDVVAALACMASLSIGTYLARQIGA
jgi:hypothetical protein